MSISNIIGEIMTSTDIFEPIVKLSDEIGPRVTGSKNSALAIQYLEKEFKELGFTIEKHTFKVNIWASDNSNISSKGTEIRATAFSYSASGEINGTVLPLVNPNTKQLEHLEFKEKIVLYHNTMGTMGSMGGRGLSREDLIQKAIDGGALGFIEISNKPGGLIERRTLKKQSSIPVVMVSKEDGFKLLRSNTKVSLTVNGNIKSVVATNLISKTESAEGNRIILSSHHDTAPNSPGAFDNGTGIALQLELARLFRDRSDIEFVVFDACKWNFAGSQTYVNKYLVEKQSQPSFVMHFDTVAKPNGTRNGVLANSMPLFGTTKKLISTYGFKMNFSPMPIFGNDAVTFHKRKVPVFVINQWKSPTFINTPYDTPEKLSIDSLKNSTVISAVVLDNALKMMKSSSRMRHQAGIG